MIGIVDVCCQAANPNMPLHPMRAFVSSPSSFRIRNAPKKIGDWQLTAVQVVVAYPDGSIKTANCVLTNGIWVGTVDGCPISGTSDQGYAVYASGVDEHGNAVTGYILGKGDVEILETDGTITPGETKTYVHLLSAQAEVPADGDLWPDGSGGWWIWQDGEAKEIGTNIGDLDDRYLTLNGATQTVTQHPVFDSGMSIYGETDIYGGSTTNFYPGSTLSIYPMNTMSETPAARFVLHGAELSGKNSGIVVVSSDISSDIDSIRYKADLTALELYTPLTAFDDLSSSIDHSRIYDSNGNQISADGGFIQAQIWWSSTVGNLTQVGTNFFGYPIWETTKDEQQAVYYKLDKTAELVYELTRYIWTGSVWQHDGSQEAFPTEPWPNEIYFSDFMLSVNKRATLTKRTLATKEYVDELVGDVEAILSAM